jgi:hypothetical protein
MLTQINSPLMPLHLEETPKQGDEALSLFQTVGILLSLYSAHWQHDSQTIQQWLKRVMPFLQHQQARLFLTEDEHKPAPQLDFYSRLGIAALLLEKPPYHSQWPLCDADIELVCGTL